MNFLAILSALLSLSAADLIGFNRLGNNVYSFNKAGPNALYGSIANMRPRYKFNAHSRRSNGLRRYFKTLPLR